MFITSLFFLLVMEKFIRESNQNKQEMPKREKEKGLKYKSTIWKIALQRNNHPRKNPIDPLFGNSTSPTITWSNHKIKQKSTTTRKIETWSH